MVSRPHHTEAWCTACVLNRANPVPPPLPHQPGAGCRRGHSIQRAHNGHGAPARSDSLFCSRHACWCNPTARRPASRAELLRACRRQPGPMPRQAHSRTALSQRHHPEPFPSCRWRSGPPTSSARRSTRWGLQGRGGAAVLCVRACTDGAERKHCWLGNAVLLFTVAVIDGASRLLPSLRPCLFMAPACRARLWCRCVRCSGGGGYVAAGHCRTHRMGPA